MLLWRSGPASRDYTRGLRSFATADLPADLRARTEDLDASGIPDQIENMSLADRTASFQALSKSEIPRTPPLKVSTDVSGRVTNI
jgi:hypothetical protein